VSSSGGLANDWSTLVPQSQTNKLGWVGSL
jgi:hypothetical protein